jgi:hypothetical protein
VTTGEGRLRLTTGGREFATPTSNIPSAEEAQAQLDTAIDWGRYGELYKYDAQTSELT